MTTLPLMLAKTATSLIVSFAPATSPIADFNDDGVVNSSDLVALTSTLGLTCEGNCPTDLNLDGLVDTSDLMILVEQWGSVPNWQPQEQEEAPAPATSSPRDPNRDMSWQGQAPVLLDAIYYDQYTKLFSHGGYSRWHNAEEYNQGEFTQAWAQENNVAVLPMVYGAVDWDHNGVLSEEDKANFIIYLDETIPADYDGPICLDLEGSWWSILDSSNQSVMDVAIDAYVEQIEFAKELRPNAKIGFWGFPKKSHTKLNSTTASIDRLLEACTAIFPDVYENNPGGFDAPRLRTHIESTIAMVNGEIPVYAQASPRYKVDSTGYRYFHDHDEFMRDQVQSALDAVWTDANGKEHKVNGIAFWEAYTYISQYTEGWSEMSMTERKAAWDSVDNLHIEYLEGMKELVDASASNYPSQEEDTIEVTVSSNSNAAAEAKEIAVATLKAAKVQQQAVLVRTIRSLNTSMVATTSSYKKSASSYRSARNNWSKARRTFSRTARKFGRNSSQYKKAYATYKTARSEMQSASKEYQEDRNEFKSARASMNQAKQQWKTANEGWSEMAAAEATLLASK